MTEQAYKEWSIQAYLDKLAGADPEPGGGSVAALTGALGAGLVTMVTALTLGKDKYAAVQGDMNDIKAAAEKLRADLSTFITADAEAYAAVAAAMKMPRDTDPQKKERSKVLQAALIGAATVPLKVAEAAVEVARLSLPAAEKGNPNAVSDAGVAVVLADAAAQSAALNVKINLAWIEDEAFKKGAWTRIEAALSETARLRDVVLALTYGKI
jgi:glutamate formiminotransferase/formiminotetrahydrofolate cyclodeaminase